MTFLELSDVIKLYKPENEELQTPALRGVDLKFDNPELAAIIGPSGSGKSTLIRLIGGLDKPSSGKIELAGVGMINSLKGKKLRSYRQETVGFISQYPDRNLLSALSAFGNVMYPMRVLGKLSREEMKQRAETLLKAVDLYNRRNHHLGQLSGGEAQRVAIAIALANNPKLILADEPTGELDSENTFKIIKYFQEINQEYESAFIVVTHDTRFANMTNNTFKIQDGRISGLHRRVSTMKMEIPHSSPKFWSKEGEISREHLHLIDRYGNLRIPPELLKELNIEDKVFLKVNKIKGIIEIIPSK